MTPDPPSISPLTSPGVSSPSRPCSDGETHSMEDNQTPSASDPSTAEGSSAPQPSVGSMRIASEQSADSSSPDELRPNPPRRGRPPKSKATQKLEHASASGRKPLPASRQGQQQSAPTEPSSPFPRRSTEPSRAKVLSSRQRRKGPPRCIECAKRGKKCNSQFPCSRCAQRGSGRCRYPQWAQKEVNKASSNTVVEDY